VAYTIQRLFEPTQLSNAAATLYTSTGVRTQVQKFTITNPSASTNYWAEVWWIPTGQTLATAYLVLPQTVMLAGQSVDVLALIGQTLAAGDYIQAQAQTANVLNVAASGLVMTP
jgi:hypothetical protein